jgi:hypothetical protein
MFDILLPSHLTTNGLRARLCPHCNMSVTYETEITTFWSEHQVELDHKSSPSPLAISQQYIQPDSNSDEGLIKDETLIN